MWLANSHYRQGLTGCALACWQEMTQLGHKYRLAAATCLASTSARAFAAWRWSTRASQVYKQKASKVHAALSFQCACGHRRERMSLAGKQEAACEKMRVCCSVSSQFTVFDALETHVEWKGFKNGALWLTNAC